MRIPSDAAEFGTVLADIGMRWQRYAATNISDEISPHDDMFNSRETWGAAHYGRVGFDAVRIISCALVLAGKSSARTVLDLPCGGGRVTRHLVAFFPGAEIYVSDLAGEKADFCRRTFGCKILASSADFTSLQPEAKFDLIFCGSLLTHLQESSFRAALTFLSRCLVDGGIAIVTLHGRSSVYVQRSCHKYIPDDRFSVIERDFVRSGFGYADYPGVAGYGISLSSPAWVCRLIAELSDMRLLGFAERCWDDHQDVAILEKRSVLSG